MIEKLVMSSDGSHSYWKIFFATIIFTVVSVAIARFVFGANPGIASIMFLTIIILPILKADFFKQSVMDEKNKKFNLWKLLKMNKNLIFVYSIIFVGVFVAYYLMTYLGILFGWNLIGMVKEQLLLETNLAGNATREIGIFMQIIENNWWVLVVSFFLALFVEGGGILFIIWNSSAWGTIFGYRAAASAIVMKINPLISAFTIQLYTTPHTFIEALAYVLAGISGAVISANIFSNTKDRKKFVYVLLGSFFAFWLGSFLLKVLFKGWVYPIGLILMFLGILFITKKFINEDKLNTVYTHNFYIMLIAIGIFILGAIIETLVLVNSSTLDKYYSAAYIYASLK
ncbi:stage II sporulation protein M [Candidatus Woesearchaeota archaeon]|nr:stage II sporulation protein M [Candidatus Woesearchaeota archaeon]MCF7900931.1 stage II sporulation protein M [Candidatus Woesearchaeota archaeon]MCF8012871.1 stage II sporulation protein M [Candidatus Woesearchaeota archaeon]